MIERQFNLMMILFNLIKILGERGSILIERQFDLIIIEFKFDFIIIEFQLYNNIHNNNY